MTQEEELYACKICGNVVKIIAAGNGILVCCGQHMQLVEDWKVYIKAKSEI
jgi:superoxide reductase